MATIKRNSSIVMKRIFFILSFFVCGIVSAQQFFFNGTVHVPKTTAQINAISSPSEGRQEANSDTGTIWYYNGSAWIDTGEVSIADGSITEAKLSTSVNASLDLADLALQSGDNVSELVNDAGYITEGGNLIPVTQAEYDLLSPTEITENDYAIVGEDDGGSGGGIQSVVAGDNITVDDTDPENPVVSAPNVAVKSSDSGTTGLVLEGTTSGTYTMSGQSWQWARSGNLVSFTILLNNINGSDPVGSLAVNIDGTSFPPISSSGYHIFSVSVSNFPIDFYWIQAKSPSNLSYIVFQISNSLGNNNRGSVANIDFTGVTEIQISGTYITND